MFIIGGAFVGMPLLICSVARNGPSEQDRTGNSWQNRCVHPSPCRQANDDPAGVNGASRVRIEMAGPCDFAATVVSTNRAVVLRAGSAGRVAFVHSGCERSAVRAGTLDPGALDQVSKARRSCGRARAVRRHTASVSTALRPSAQRRPRRREVVPARRCCS
jgi:hypothetical protein